jgi:hypothetical protein
MMRKIRIHGHNRLQTKRHGETHTGDMCCAQAKLGRTVQGMDTRVLGREGIDDLAGAIRRIVIDDNHMRTDRQCEDLTDEGRYVVALIIGRNDNRRGHALSCENVLSILCLFEENANSTQLLK